MFTPYKDLLDWQKFQISKMYSDQSTVEKYEYDFDEKGYHGRRPAEVTESKPVESVKESVVKAAKRTRKK